MPDAELDLAMRLSILAVEESILPSWNFNPIHTNHLSYCYSFVLKVSEAAHLGVDHEAKGIGDITLESRNFRIEEVVESTFTSLEET